MRFSLWWLPQSQNVQTRRLFSMSMRKKACGLSTNWTATTKVQIRPLLRGFPTLRRGVPF